jgi:hypothetical protein
LTALFAVNARTYWSRRGDPVTDNFKEAGREMIRAMLAVRMGDGEVLTYDRVDPDPSPTMAYADGTGQWIVSPRFVGLRGSFPDGAVRMLGTKFVYACGQRGILQLLILAAG